MKEQKERTTTVEQCHLYAGEVPVDMRALVVATFKRSH